MDKLELLGLFPQELGEALAEGTHELYRTLLLARLCLKRMQAHPQEYQALHQSHGKEQSIHLLRLDIAGHLADCTRRMRGCVYFSATLDPLSRMRQLLGGTEEDATFALPSPFPSGNLMILQRAISSAKPQPGRLRCRCWRCMMGRQASILLTFPAMPIWN